MNSGRVTFFYFLFFLFPLFGFTQYVLNGAATQNSCNCYTLTPAQFTQTGSVWNANKINLNNSFDFTFNVFLGCQDANGADGIAFILQPISTSLGTSGGGMGFEGITPSVGIVLDTWQNTNNIDPLFDHVSIQANGIITHGNDLAGPVQASAASDNIEDCQWHTFRIVWNAVTKTITVYFDGTQRLTATVDMVATYFNNDPNVYWGFTAATGGANNLQQFCTALNPDFTTNFANNAACNGTPAIFTDNSAAFTTIQSWRWDFGDGAISTLQNPPAHLYSSPGTYQVKLVITGLDGCVSDTMRKTITIGSKPVADFQVFDTCDGKALRIINQSSNAVGLLNQWTWMLDGSVVSSDQQPVITVQSAGLHTLKLIVKSNIGCESDTVTKQVMIAAAPVVDINAENGCINQPISFSAFQTGPPAGIVQWNWSFGDGGNAQVQNPVHVYSAAGNVTVQLTAIAVNGCGSDVVLKTIHVDSISARTINDTTILPNLPFLLSVNISGSFNGQPAVAWSPSAGLSNSSITNPVATLQDDMTYIITATSAAGCTARDTVNIKVFKGSAVYVPTGFTPNADGRNDFLRGLYIGIIKVDYFKVYNRWGQLIFNTNSLADGWDGTIKGVKQPAGTYVWMVRAVDLAGKVYEMKGTSTLIR